MAVSGCECECSVAVAALLAQEHPSCAFATFRDHNAHLRASESTGGVSAAALNVYITKFHTNLVPPYPRIHFILMLFALLRHVPRRGRCC